MKKKIDISVCIPTYKRPSMLQQAVKSYLAQDYNNSELVIVDDASNDGTEDAMKDFLKLDKRINYEKNKKNIGYCKNFLKTILKAQGKYLFFLGDDDMILGKKTLEKYVDVFEKYPNVNFIYSNIIQFNNKFLLDYVYKFFDKNTLFAPGEKAIKTVWLKSTFIAGIGLRNTPLLKKYYPKENVLFPQVEMIGKVLLDSGGYGLNAFSVGARAHSDQLGFHMMEKKRVVGRERHANLELYEITDHLVEHLVKKRKGKKNIMLANTILKTVNVFLKDADSSIIFAEGTKIKKGTFLRTIFNSLKKEKRIKHSPIFWIHLLAFLMLPQFILVKLKELYRSLLRKVYWKSEEWYFKKEKNKILGNIQYS